MTSGLIINPRSGRKNGKGVELAGMLKGKPGVFVHVLEDFPEITGALDSCASAGVTDLFISSGDGTIHEIQTQLVERKPFPALPRLALLPHGTTNMTAADIGFRHKNLAAQAAFILAPTSGERQTRPTLRVANPKDGRPRHGMFLGTGAVWKATKFCQDAIHRTGLKGDFATFATLATAVIKSLLTKPNPGDPDRIDRPYAMTVASGNEVKASGPQLLLLATTLDKLILGTRPFWGGKHGPIRATALPYPVPSIPRWLVPLMYGSEERAHPAGSVSFSTTAFSVAGATPFVIDGEFFDPPEGDALRVETGSVFTYLRG
jgi:diacylglycerol kinase (ATP)